MILILTSFMENVANVWMIFVSSNGFCGFPVNLMRGFSQDKVGQLVDKWWRLCLGSLFANAHYK